MNSTAMNYNIRDEKGNLDLYRFKLASGMDDQGIAWTLKRAYTFCNEDVIRAACYPELSAVRLTPGAEDFLLRIAGDGTPRGTIEPEPEKPMPRKERRKLPTRLQVRVTKADSKRLHAAFKRMGFSTVQDGLAHLIQDFLKEQQNETV